MVVQGLQEQGVRWGHPQQMLETFIGIFFFFNFHLSGVIGIVLVDLRQVHGPPLYGAGLKGHRVFLVRGAPAPGSWPPAPL